MNSLTFSTPRILRLILVGLMLFGVSTPAWAQQSTAFPFHEVQKLTPEQVRIQKYKLERLRIVTLRQDWTVIRGINEKIDDATLLKMVGETDVLKAYERDRSIGNGITLGGLVLLGSGGILLTDFISFDNSFFVGLGLIVAGAAAALIGESWAGNIDESLTGHIIERVEAEKYVKQYNSDLKKELQLENVPGLDL